jgi:PAS domain S-box-containing protein
MFGHQGVVWRYGLAVAAVAVAAGARLALNPVLSVHAPYLPFTLAVTVGALVGGRGPGLAANALSALVIDWLFLRPPHSLAITDRTAAWTLGLFVVSTAPVALLVGSLRESLLARARTEKALRRQAQLIDLSHDAIITMDSGRRILTWNKGAEEIYGWPEQDAAGTLLHQLLQTEGPLPFPDLDELLQREQRWDGEMRQTARDGRQVVVESRQVLLGSEGGLPERILAINRDITERKRIDEALRVSQARFELILEAENVGVWDLDLTSHAAWRSRQHDAIFGYPALLPQWTYEMFLDHVLPEDRKEVDRSVRQALVGGADLQFECRIRRADGALRWIWATGRTQLDPQGLPLRMCGIVRDITGQKTMEENLRQSEDQFRTLANAIPQLCGMADSNGRFFWVNQRWCDYTGLSAEQSKETRWRSALDPEGSAAGLERWQHSIVAGEPFESELAVRGADGVVRPFLARAMPVCDRGGNVVRWFGTMTDISEQRKTEDDLRKAHSEELARAVELQAIMDAAPVAMFISHDPECRHILGNRSAYDLFRELPGINLSPEGGEASACRMTRDGKEVLPQELPMQRAAATGQGVYDQELELAYADGSRATIIGNAVPLLDTDGRARGAVGVFVDITERKTAEERLRQAHKLESVALLAGGIAHDFNNLLTVIMGSADFALRKCPDCDEMRHVVASSQQAAHLTRQLLAYAGKGQFVSETFRLMDFILRRSELLSASLPPKVKLSFNLSPEELLIKADPSQIEQILVNLLINAGEAIPPGTDGRVQIATSTCDVAPEVVRAHGPAYDARPGQFVCLEVSDNGSGMDEATLAQIFNPFFSTRFTGRGLGLAAVQGIVRSCNGFIEVQSSCGAGSTFRVFLPSAPRKASLAVLPAASHSGGLPRGDRAPAAVLVVDDEQLVRGLACTALRAGGYEVLEASDGRDALEVLAAAAMPPSLVLLDFSMPGMDAGELVPILNRQYPDLRIVLTSGYSEEDARRGFPPEAIAGFLQKPYTVPALLQKVEETLHSGGGPNEVIPAAA